MKKGVLSLLLAMMVLFSGTLTAHADLSVSATEYTVGETFKVAYTVPNDVTGIGAVTLLINYDSSVLEATKVSAKRLNAYDEEYEETYTVRPIAPTSDTTGSFGGSWTDTYCYGYIEAGQTLMEVTFTVKGEATNVQITSSLLLKGIDPSSGNDNGNDDLTYLAGVSNNPIVLNLNSAAHTHTLTAHPAVSPTCETTGNIAYWTCSGCGGYFSDSNGENEISASDIILGTVGHKLIPYGAIEPTCQSHGNIAYWKCSYCNTYFSDAEGENEIDSVVLPQRTHKPANKWSYNETHHWNACVYSCGFEFNKNTHNLVEKIDKAASCSEPGSKHYECECGYKTDSESVPAKGHSLIAHAAKDASCTAEGNIAYWTCSGCGKYFSDAEGQNEISKADTVVGLVPHNVEFVPALEATCGQTGHVAHYKCVVCGKLFSDAAGSNELSKEDITDSIKSHNPEDKWSFDADGHWHECSYGCGSDLEYAVHSLVEKLDKAATCTEPGSKHYECECGYKTEAETIPVIAHTLTAHAANAATCTAEGNIAYWTCDVCAKYFSDAEGKNEITAADTVVAKLAHTLTAHEANAATCTADGNIAYWTCDVCSKYFSDAEGKTEITAAETVDPQIPHKPAEKWSYDNSNHWHECAYNCGTDLDKAEHELVEKIDKEATCTETGRKHNECECGYKTEAETIPVIAHTLTAHAANAATCTADGNIAYWTCDVCSKYFSDAEGKTEITAAETVDPQIPHKPAEKWSYDNSNHWHECAYNCGTDLDKAEHELVEKIDKEATCTEAGSKHSECECGYKTEAETIPVIAHTLTAHAANAATCTADGNIAYWTCDVCGKYFSDAEGKTEITAAQIVDPQIPHKPAEKWSYDNTNHWHECAYNCGTDLDKVAHELVEKIDKEATCTETGSKHNECDCGYKTESETIPVIAHTLTAHAANPATCTGDGNIAYWTCDVCSKYFSDAEGKTEITAAETVDPQKDHKAAEKWTYVATNHWRECAYGCGTKLDYDIHSLTEVIDKEATCTEAGSKHSECECGYKTESETIPVIAHTLTAHAANAATCTAEGNIAYWTCDVCGKYFSDAEGKTEITAAETVVAKIAHTLTAHEANAATCTGDGNIAYWTCDVCSKYFSDAEGKTEITAAETVDPQIPHKPAEKWSYDNTNHWRECAYDCGTALDYDVHSLTEVIDKEATCTETGSKHSECECGYKTESETIPVIAHTLTAHAANAATCTAEGNIAYWTCDVCGKYFSDAEGKTEITAAETVDPQIPHKPAEKWSYDNSNHWHECAYNCGTDLDKAEHELVEKIDKEATCTETGRKHNECECGYKTEAETIPVIAHTLTAHAANAATCTADGNIAYWTCDVCSKYFSDAEGKTEITAAETVDPKIPHEGIEEWSYNETHHWHLCKYTCGNTVDSAPHSFTEVIEKAATCTETGTKHFECACGYKTESETIPVIAHTLTAHAANPASCTADGNIAYWTCDVCSKYFSDAEGKTEITAAQIVDPQKDHKPAEKWSYDSSNHWHECAYNCGTELDKDEHELVEKIDKEATCTEAGSKHYECECGYKTEAETIPVIAHTLTAHAANAATCTAEGNIAYWTCDVCGKYFSDAEGKTEITAADTVVAKIAHTLTAHEANAATCTADGNIAYWTCGVCGKYFSDAEGKTEITAAETIDPQIPHKPAEKWSYDNTNHWHECAYNCGTDLDKAEHELVEKIDKEATCTETGSKHYECECGYKTKSETVPVKPHNLTHHEAAAPSCKADGHTEHWTCDACSKYFSDADGKNEIKQEDTVVGKVDHVLSHKEYDAPTCTKEGNTEHWLCDVCGKCFSDAEGANEIAKADTVIKTIDHQPVGDWKNDAKEHWHACGYGCGTRVDAEDHDFGPWENSTSETDGTKGSRVRYCTVCGYMQTQNLTSPPTGDTSRIAEYSAVMALSTIALGAIAFVFKKQKRKS